MDDGSWDAETIEPEAAAKKADEADNWDDEDIDDDTEDTLEDEGAEFQSEELKKAETIQSEKTKPSDAIKEKEQEELKKRLEEHEEGSEEGSEAGGQQEEAPDVSRANEATGDTGVPGDASGIDASTPSSKDDFGEFEKLLKHKLCPLENSAHYPGFLESLFQDLCISLEIEDLKKINSSVSVLLSEKQKQEKQLNKGKKKKKGTVIVGGLKAKMKDDLADYGQFEGGYTQDYEDFM